MLELTETVQGEDVPEEIRSVLTLESAQRTMSRANEEELAEKIVGSLVMEKEHTLLFADTNLGKSIFATQVALAKASGESICPYLSNETDASQVLFLDFELGPQQFARRYAEIDGRELVNPFQFPRGLIRAEIDPEKLPPGDMGDLILRSIREEVERRPFTMVVVDNITWLSDDTERGDAAGILMKEFHKLVRELGIAILTLAHVPKVPTHTPITLNHLAGSKKLSNFADAVFTMGRDWHRPDSHVYLKQLKVRAAGALEYGADNVVMMERTKPTNFLGFEFCAFACEDDICRKENEQKRDERKGKEESLVMALRSEHPNASLRELAKLAGNGINHMKVKRILDSCNM